MTLRLRFAHRKARGFTILEALVSAVLLGVGIAASIGAIGEMIKAETGSREREKIHRMALDRFAELRATGDYLQSPLDGDFQDRGEQGYTWSSALEPTGIENLNRLTVTVSKTANSKLDTSISALVYQPPIQTQGGGG